MPSSERVAAERRRRRTKLTVAALGILAVALVMFGVMLKSDPTKTTSVVAAGIFGSLVASCLMLLVSGIVLGPLRDEQAASAERLEVALDTLDVAIPLLSQATQHGFVAVKPKSEYSHEDWSEVLREARERLLLVGHALDKWCAEDIRPLFEETLERLARDGKTVVLLTLPLEGANTRRIGEQRGKDYSRRVRTTLEIVAGVIDRLPSECRSALRVRALSSDVDMPYMLVANEHVVITCAYPTTAQSSDSMLTTTAQPDKPFGRAVREDLRQLIDRHTEEASLRLEDR